MNGGWWWVFAMKSACGCGQKSVEGWWCGQKRPPLHSSEQGWWWTMNSRRWWVTKGGGGKRGLSERGWWVAAGHRLAFEWVGGVCQVPQPSHSSERWVEVLNKVVSGSGSPFRAKNTLWENGLLHPFSLALSAQFWGLSWW